MIIASGARETHFKDLDEIGATIAEFALGSIATMARTNPHIKAPGLVPHLGSQIGVYWNYLIALLVGIATVHFLLLIGSIYFYSLGLETTRSTRNTTGTELRTLI